MEQDEIVSGFSDVIALIDKEGLEKSFDQLLDQFTIQTAKAAGAEAVFRKQKGNMESAANGLAHWATSAVKRGVVKSDDGRSVQITHIRGKVVYRLNIDTSNNTIELTESKALQFTTL